MRFKPLIISICYMLLFAGCAQKHYAVLMKPQGKELHRELTVDGLNEEECANLSKLLEDAYGKKPEEKAKGEKKKKEKSLSIKGIFGPKLPNDLGGAGYYVSHETKMGSIVLYAERLQGEDEPTLSLKKKKDAINRFVDLFIGWLDKEAKNEPGYEDFREFLDTKFRVDMENIGLYVWLFRDKMPLLLTVDNKFGNKELGAKLSEADTFAAKAMGKEILRIALYLLERGYFKPESLPQVLTAFFACTEEPAVLFHLVRDKIVRQLRPDVENIQENLPEFLKDDKLGESFTEYLKTTDEYQKILAEWKESHKNKPDAGEPDPSEFLWDLFSTAYFEGNTGGDLFTADTEYFLAFESESKPVVTNGEWIPEEQVIGWAHQSGIFHDAQLSVTPPICYAAWSFPNEEYQQEHFGCVLLQDAKLGIYCMWHMTLSKEEAREWDTFVDGLTPGQDIKKAFEEAEFSEYLEYKLEDMSVYEMLKSSLDEKAEAKQTKEKSLRRIIEKREKAKPEVLVKIIPNRMAIVGFKNLSDDPDNDWIGMIIRSDLGNKLDNLKWITFPTGEEISEIRQQQHITREEMLNPPEALKIGRLLNLKNIIMGAYAVEEGRVNFSMRIMDVSKKKIIKSANIKIRKDELFDLPGQLAKVIVEIIDKDVRTEDGRAQFVYNIPKQPFYLTPEERQFIEERPTEDILAYEAYARGACHFINDDWEKAAEQFEAALKFDPGFINAWIVKGQVFEAQEKYQPAFEAYEIAKELLQEINDKRDLSMILNLIGTMRQKQEQYVEAMFYLGQSLLIDHDLEDYPNLALRLNNIGTVYFHDKNYEKAIAYYEQALPIEEQLKNKRGQVRLLCNIAYSLLSQNDYDAAIKKYQEALNIERKFDNEPGEAQLLRNIGVMYLQMDNYSKALSYFNDALQILKETHFDSCMADTLADMGSLYQAKNEYAKANKYYELALKLARKLNNEEKMIRSLLNLGKLYQAQETHAEAIKCFEEVLELEKKKGHELEVAQIAFCMLKSYIVLDTLPPEGFLPTLKEAIKTAWKNKSIDEKSYDEAMLKFEIFKDKYFEMKKAKKELEIPIKQ